MTPTAKPRSVEAPMSYAYVQNSTASQERGSPPSEGVRQDTGQTVSGIKPNDTATLAACGWHPVTVNARPADTATNTSDRTLVVSEGLPVETWTVRAKTQAEIDSANAAANKSSIETNLEQDMAAMQTIIDTPNATINSNPAAHIKNIARNLKRLDRTALQDYTAAD